ncbi:DNA repair protein RadC [Ferrimonas sp. SCSIO 43195]|uniref:RadC family protein n=1 Tax=Ferrimonas sp. SCSIO 43195 TaxID=2822844 RepID=UPI0020753C8B|nr:DNA repair protein RadC [Ferrimonas sp. SCSIO 43195]USD35983.1 DNA repair protein RadC [Ferrimonas sp. SCSIO 43195]
MSNPTPPHIYPGHRPGDHIIHKALTILESRQQQPGDSLTSALDAKNYLRLKLAEQQREVFAVLMLDSQHRVIEYQELFLGTIDAANVYPREVVKAVLGCNAAAVILSHNHPSGHAEPSQADRQITSKLQRALTVIDVPVLDHLVIGNPDVTSFAEWGWL